MNPKFKPGFTFSCLFIAATGFAQPYAPPVGQPGTTAMYKDSVAFVNWASGCTVTRGYQDISNPSLGLASVGDATMATGKAMDNPVLSLGDGGVALCTFSKPVKNGPGFDFAVFENGFDDVFLELAFVEVSSDGVNFVRFPAHSLTSTANQTSSFGSTDATKINNLAGKYRGGYGTPFDLQELAGRPNLDIDAITHVKIIDVIGSINPAYATYDSFGNMVNDPWPTAFPSGGFDLDAVGVIHEAGATGMQEEELDQRVQVYPNPLQPAAPLIIQSPVAIQSVRLSDLSGKVIVSAQQQELDLSLLKGGLYLLTIETEQGILHKKIVVE